MDLVVEDLISTGGSSLECVEALREAGCEVIGLIAIPAVAVPIKQSASGKLSLTNLAKPVSTSLRTFGYDSVKRLKRF